MVVTIEGREGSVARRAVWLEMKFGNEKPFEMDFAGLETRRRRRSATLNDVLEAILRHVPELEFTEQNSTH